MDMPGGIPSPDTTVARSSLPKEDQFKDQKALQIIRDLTDHCPAGLLGSLIGDVQDISYAYMDVSFLQEIQAADQSKKGFAQAAVAHPIGEALKLELDKHQKEKYGSRGVTYYKDLRYVQYAVLVYVVYVVLL